MKVFFDGVDFGSRSGPNTFAHRLAVQLSLMGHTIADPDDYDVHLAFIEPTRQTLPSKPLVQRLDGIWFKPGEFATKNVGIKRCYDAASAVVWQSKFDRCMTTRWWGHPRSGKIIRNGVLKRSVAVDPALQQLTNKYDKVFACGANWHAQKRLKANVDLYMHLRDKHYLSSCLIILGAHPDVRVADPHVFYADSVPEDVYLQVYSIADWMLHLAWLDHCPNVVIEAMSQGTPVICSEDGGTRELVELCGGIIIKERSRYSYELADYDNPPNIDVTQVGLLPDLHIDISGKLDIETVASEYDKLFKELVR